MAKCLHWMEFPQNGVGTAREMVHSSDKVVVVSLLKQLNGLSQLVSYQDNPLNKGADLQEASDTELLHSTKPL